MSTPPELTAGRKYAMAVIAIAAILLWLGLMLDPELKGSEQFIGSAFIVFFAGALLGMARWLE